MDAWHTFMVFGLVCGLSFVFFDVLVCMRTLYVNFKVVLGCVTIALVLDTLSLEGIHVRIRRDHRVFRTPPTIRAGPMLSIGPN